jgi:hypothetical protein
VKPRRPFPPWFELVVFSAAFLLAAAYGDVLLAALFGPS